MAVNDLIAAVTTMLTDLSTRVTEMDDRNRVHLDELRYLVISNLPENLPPPAEAAAAEQGVQGAPVEERRETFIVAPANTIANAGPRMGVMPLAVSTVIHRQERVDPGMQIKFASLPALKVAIENQAAHLAQFDQTRPLAFFVTASLLKVLVQNEHRYGRNMDMTENTILRSRDDTFTAYVRVTTMGTKEAWTATILKSVPTLKASGSNPDREMITADYDKFFHANVNVHLDTLEKVLLYAFQGATVLETESWPKEDYGKGDDYGRVQVLCRSMGQYKMNFENRIGMENLKKMKKVDEWFAVMRNINNQLANKAVVLRADDSKIARMVKLDTIEKEIISNRELYPKAVMTRDGPRDTRLPMTPYLRPTTAGQPPFRSNASEPNRPLNNQDYQRRRYGTAATLDSVISRGDEQFLGRFPEEYYPRDTRVEVEDDYNLLDETGECQNPLVTEEVRRQYSPFGEENEDEWAYGRYDESFGAFNSMMSFPRSPMPGGQKTLFDPKAPKPRDPTKPCFRHFEKKDCPGNCGWDHSQAGMHKLMLERMNVILDSPFVPLELLKSEIYKREHGTPQRRNAALAALSPVTEGRSESNDLRSVSSPSPARVLESSQPIQIVGSPHSFQENS